MVLRIISLGAGVQSTTMALMAAHGETGPMPDCAIFADTQGEPKAVYDHLAWLMSPNVLPFPVHVVTAGNLWESAVKVRAKRDGTGTYIATALPVFMDERGKFGMAMRACTRDFKITPIVRKAREILGRSGTAEMWVGISTDEAARMKPARQKWIKTRWPLIERRMSRGDCLQWLKRNGYPNPPKSACTFCPFHSDDAWKSLTGAEFADAVAKEREMQAAYANATSIRGVPYLHSSRRPLDTVVLDGTNQLNMFNNECEGMCGV